MINFHAHDVDLAVSILLDAISAIIVLVILVTLPGVPMRTKRFKKLFLAALLIGFIAMIIDCASYVFELLPVSRLEMVGIIHLDCVMIVVFGYVKCLCVMGFIGSGHTHAKYVYFLVHVCFGLMLISHMIPPIFKAIYYLPEGAVDIVHGPLYPAFSVLSTVSVFLPTIMIMANYKKIGLLDSFLLCAIQVGEVLCFFLFWNSTAPSAFLVAMILLIIYISVYQGHTWRSFEQENELNRQQLALTMQEAEIADMRTKVMLSQIQPHFVYNTLTTIAYLCRKDPENAEKLTNRFSNYLRSNIDVFSDTRRIPVEKGLEIADNYLNIEKYRFKDRINVEYHISAKNFTVPMLTIQPLVENAVKHGICKREDGGTIVISTFEDDANNYVRVEDNGVGFDEEAIKNDGKQHIGIENVRSRLKLCGDFLNIESTPGVGTTATIIIPKER